jgi:hypothetical protein
VYRSLKVVYHGRESPIPVRYHDLGAHLFSACQLATSAEQLGSKIG